MSYYALVPAAGSGARMGSTLPKQYLPLAGRPLIWHALATLCAVPQITRVYVVLAPDDECWPAADMAGLATKLEVLRCGGETRAESVTNGLRAMAEGIPGIADDWVLVHDAARPCLTVAQVQRLIDEVGEDDAGGILAIPVADTLKRTSRRKDDLHNAAHVMVTVPREGLWQAQTPQMFRHRLLLDALDFAPQVTDESSAIEALGLHPRLVEADSSNFKVTYPRDLELAALILGQRSQS
jgi:2-C-methyl-D-erythritol 4-phosphate cytidylyltransferase